MRTESILLAGSILVPLAALALFAILYLRRYKQYLLEKNSYTGYLSLGDLCKGYVFARISHDRMRGSKFWWYFFGVKYIDLLNFESARFQCELDKLEYFEDPKNESFIFGRHSFLRQWIEMHGFLFETSYYSKDYQHELRADVGKDPFGWMGVAIAGKLYELYKKHALYILRTKGYVEFSKFLSEYHDKSQQYPHGIPFSEIYKEKFHLKILDESSMEVAERLRAELKIAQAEGKRASGRPYGEVLLSLTKTFILADKNGYAYPGLSQVEREIYAQLEKEKVK